MADRPKAACRDDRPGTRPDGARGAFLPAGATETFDKCRPPSPEAPPGSQARRHPPCFRVRQTAIGSLHLTTRAVAHGIPAFAVRVESADRSLVYSGDTAPCPNLTQLAGECDVLLCEAESTRTPDNGDPVHHTPEDAGDTARTARAHRLILTHIGRSLTPQEAVTRASARYNGPIDHATLGTTYTSDHTTTATAHPPD
ncbi:MBL fold metallo-hydrolase [Streptomyces albus]|uniref:MBL fold metallo-hydrolase n=1 Tax=Streptomyces albus TaxID=1888 RepID=UPI0036FE1482